MSDLLQRLRDSDPADPFWKGVAGTDEDERAATVRFHEPLDPRPVEVGETQVLCHLHDEEALERARRAAAG